MSRPVVIGEAVLEESPGEPARLAGTALRVAWHLAGLGADPLLITRLGADDEGDAIVRRLSAWGLDTRGIQRDESLPTTRMRHASHERRGIAPPPPQSFDAIDDAEMLEAIDDADASLVYHGTLAFREVSALSRLRRVCRAAELPRFVDLDLHEPWWTAPLALDVLSRAEWAKLSRDEAAALFPAAALDDVQLVRQVERAVRTRTLSVMIVTLGADGALLVEKDGPVHRVEAENEGEFVDPSGTGEAFASACLLGALRGWPWTLTLRLASRFAGRVGTVPGALPDHRTFYDDFLRWRPA